MTNVPAGFHLQNKSPINGESCEREKSKHSNGSISCDGRSRQAAEPGRLAARAQRAGPRRPARRPRSHAHPPPPLPAASAQHGGPAPRRPCRRTGARPRPRRRPRPAPRSGRRRPGRGGRQAALGLREVGLLPGRQPRGPRGDHGGDEEERHGVLRAPAGREGVLRPGARRDRGVRPGLRRLRGAEARLGRHVLPSHAAAQLPRPPPLALQPFHLQGLLGELLRGGAEGGMRPAPGHGGEPGRAGPLGHDEARRVAGREDELLPAVPGGARGQGAGPVAALGRHRHHAAAAGQRRPGAADQEERRLGPRHAAPRGPRRQRRRRRRGLHQRQVQERRAPSGRQRAPGTDVHRGLPQRQVRYHVRAAGGGCRRRRGPVQERHRRGVRQARRIQQARRKKHHGRHEDHYLMCSHFTVCVIVKLYFITYTSHCFLGQFFRCTDT